ncbi:MAG TPA: DUF6544 family protein [Thermoanaerobaculia bacterium]|jgi:hypothetical protein|nr:DUF6544 family protein [Thermoanaerobaculia bacterium]
MKTLIVVAGVLIVAFAVLNIAAFRWSSQTAAQIAKLGGATPTVTATYDAAQLRELPAPVVRYFHAVLRDGQPLITRARLTQRGQFLVQPTANGWRPFAATETFVTQPAGFVWDARIRMAPGFPVLVRDAFVGGRGSMHASLLAVWPLASVENTADVAAGALHRYLAEAVWLPTALLPSQGVTWSPIDEQHPRATITADGTIVSLDFTFGADGLVESVFTSARMRDVDGRAIPTPWQGRFARYEERHGMKIPIEGEVEWLLSDGPQVYWRGEITDVEVEYGTGR